MWMDESEEEEEEETVVKYNTKPLTFIGGSLPTIRMNSLDTTPSNQSAIASPRGWVTQSPRTRTTNNCFYSNNYLNEYPTDSLLCLPDEIIMVVFSFLSARELLKIALVCSHCRVIAEDEVLWRYLYLDLTRPLPTFGDLKKFAPLPRPVRMDIDGVRDRARAMGGSHTPSMPTFASIAPSSSPFTSTAFASYPLATANSMQLLSSSKCWKPAYEARYRTRRNWRQARAQPTILEKQHTAAIFCLDLCGPYMVSGSSDYSLKIWDAQSKQCLHTLTGHQYAVWCVKILGQSETVLSASYDSTIKYWDMHTGQCMRTLNGHTSAIWAMDCYNNKIATGSTDTQLRVWDLETGACIRRIAAKQDTIWCCSFIDDNTIASGGTDVRLWDIRLPTASGGDTSSPASPASSPASTSRKRATPVAIFSGHSDAVRCVQADTNRLVTGSYDSTSFVFDRVANKMLYDLHAHSDSITTLQYDSSGMLITSSFDSMFAEFDLTTGELVATWGNTPPSSSPSPNPSMTTASTTATTPTATTTHTRMRDKSESAGKVYCLAFDDNILVSAREDATMCIYDFSYSTR